MHASSRSSRSRARLASLSLVGALLLGTVASSPAGAQDAPPPTAPEVDANIVGGSVASPGQFPWQAALIRRGASRSAGFSCGGSVLSRSWILTAAHCVLDYDDEYPDATYGNYVAPSYYDVLTGTNSITGTDGQRLQVVGIHVHPSYDWWYSDYDVALLRVARPTSATEISVIGSSPTELALDDAGRQATVSGWGVTSFGSSVASASLRYVGLEVGSDALCGGAYPPSRVDEYGSPLAYRAWNMLCAGPAGNPLGSGKDSCQGDSGGPLVTQAADSSWRQIGVVSFGFECARKDNPGIYHRLTSSASWISQQRRFGPFAPDGTAYITRQYRDFAGRAPSSSELATWRSKLASAPAADIITSLQAASAWDGNAGMNVRLYSAAFQRNPDTSGLDYWVRQRWAGRGPVSIANHFAASSEFTAKYGSLTNDAFIVLVYQNVFGRNPDAGGRAYWNRKLADGTGRGQVLYELSNSNEYRTKTATAVRIITTRFGLLREAPTPAEITASEAMSQRTLIDTLRTSYRYASRFSS